MMGMIFSTHFKNDAAFSRGAFWLYLAVFSMACLGGVYMTSLPFILKNIGAADTSMGICLSLGFAGCLFGCLVGSAKVDRYNPKSVVLTGSAVMTAVIILLWCADRNKRLLSDPSGLKLSTCQGGVLRPALDEGEGVLKQPRR